MSAAIAPSRPRPDACISRPRSRTRRMPSASERTPAATSAEYWPIEWPAAKAGRGSATPAAAQRSRSAARIAIEVARSAGWAFSVRSSRSAGPSQASAAERLAEGGVGRLEDRAGAGGPLGQLATHPDRLRALAGEDEGE